MNIYLDLNTVFLRYIDQNEYLVSLKAYNISCEYLYTAMDIVQKYYMQTNSFIY